MEKDESVCPSYRCKENAILLGVIQSDGHVEFLESRTLVNQNFVTIANKGRSPEKRFRFGGKCGKNSCGHWKENQCGLIFELIDRIGKQRCEKTEIPDCSIRPECRWYNQVGSQACTVCPYVITDLYK